MGFTLPISWQHVDNYVSIDHVAPNCTSNQLFKGVLDDYATGAFNGAIKVNRIAQGTRAYQSNNNILLTDDAKMDTKPQLEIYADDVKCSHGATVGSLMKMLSSISGQGESIKRSKVNAYVWFCP